MQLPAESGGVILMIVKTYRCNESVHKDFFDDFRGVHGIDSRYLYGAEHLHFACTRAKREGERGGRISNDPFMEAVLRASGQRQIKKALAIFGLNSSHEIAIFGEEIPDELLEDLGAVEVELIMDTERLERLKQTFSITETEIAAVSDTPAEAVKALIKERISLVSIR